MIVGVPKEIKKDEYRVAIVPAGVRSLILSKVQVLIQTGAGEHSGISDDEFTKEGAEIVATAEEVFDRADMIIKVKEPIGKELVLLKPNQILYTYLHLAAVPDVADALIKREVTCVAYETVQLDNGSLPLLIPMSEVAGRMSVHEGAKYLEKERGGKGILLSGVPGVDSGRVVILGGGIVGTNAAKIAHGMGAQVTILDTNLPRLRYLDDIFQGRIKLLMSNTHNIMYSIKIADLIVGAVLIPGGSTPKLVTRDMLSAIPNGSVLVDVAVDQGGCFETTKPTSHSDPTFVVDGVTHYCVANMPGAVPRTSTFALTNATFPYAYKLATQGLCDALRASPPLSRGLNLHQGKVTHEKVAQALNLNFEPVQF